MAARSGSTYSFACLHALLQLAAFAFSLPLMPPECLLLLNIICISCFSTCNAGFCPCLTRTVHSFGLGPILNARFFYFFYFILDKMDTERGLWILCLCDALTPVINWVWLCLFVAAPRRKESCEPMLRVSHGFLHFFTLSYSISRKKKGAGGGVCFELE